MCYGDIDHGKDGYYRDWAERQEQEHEPSPDPLKDSDLPF
jgi:hypothetical protein